MVSDFDLVLQDMAKNPVKLDLSRNRRYDRYILERDLLFKLKKSLQSKDGAHVSIILTTFPKIWATGVTEDYVNEYNSRSTDLINSIKLNASFNHVHPMIKINHDKYFGDDFLFDIMLLYCSCNKIRSNEFRTMAWTHLVIYGLERNKLIRNKLSTKKFDKAIKIIEDRIKPEVKKIYLHYRLKTQDNKPSLFGINADVYDTALDGYWDI